MRATITLKQVSTIVLVVVGAVLATTIVAASKLETSLTRSFTSKGGAIAIALASAAEQSIGADASMIQSSVDANKVIYGVRYIFLQDARGVPYVHTFSPEFPAGLEQKNPVALGETLDGRVKIAPHVRFSGRGNAQEEAIDVAAPIAGGALGVVHVGMDTDAIAEQVRELRRTLFGLGALIALIGIAISVGSTVITIIRPVRQLTRVTADIVARGDLTQKISINSHDELGELAETFSKMIAKLREIPLKLDESTVLLASSVTELSGSITSHTETAARQAAALQETQVTAYQIRQTSLVASQKAEGVLRYAERADTIGREGEAAVQKSLTALTDIRGHVTEMAEQINVLGARTMQIGTVTAAVKDLADQSNMLALNAAIEAVRAGENGKGFSVVAREIRNLADQSVQATRRVREILDDVASAVQTAVSTMDAGARRIDAGLADVKLSGEKLSQLSVIVKENSSAVRQIGAAVGQQNAGVSQITSAVVDQSAMMEETMRRLTATEAAVATLKQVSTQLVSIVTQFHA